MKTADPIKDPDSPERKAIDILYSKQRQVIEDGSTEFHLRWCAAVSLCHAQDYLFRNSTHPRCYGFAEIADIAMFQAPRSQ